MIQFFVRGGVFMIPIGAVSVLALAIFLERLWSLRRSKIIPDEFTTKVRELVKREKIPDAIALCRRYNAPIANILAAAMRNFGKEREAIKERVEEVGRKEAASLERFLETLSTLASVATLLGLLGTIAGMIEIFSVISEQAVVAPTSLAHGISVALYTTAFGLSVAIPTIVAHRYLTGKAEGLILQMEEISIDMVELLKEKEEDNFSPRVSDAV